MSIVICQYCLSGAELVTGDVIYPHRPDLYGKYFYRCAPCKAHVGCHPGGTKPLGRLADAELRKYKSLTHKAFDPLWKDTPKTRAQAYAWLAKAMGLSKGDCHVGMFDIAMCKKAISICLKKQNK